MSREYGKGRWVPNPAPIDPEDLHGYINTEFQRLSEVINADTLTIPVAYKEPLKPRVGDVFVSSAEYSPEGDGVYYYNSSNEWVKL